MIEVRGSFQQSIYLVWAASYLQYEVDQSQQNPQCESSGAISLLIGDQVAEPQWDWSRGLVDLTQFLNDHQPPSLETESLELLNYWISTAEAAG